MQDLDLNLDKLKDLKDIVKINSICYQKIAIIEVFFKEKIIYFYNNSSQGERNKIVNILKDNEKIIIAFIEKILSYQNDSPPPDAISKGEVSLLPTSPTILLEKEVPSYWSWWDFGFLLLGPEAFLLKKGYNIIKYKKNKDEIEQENAKIKKQNNEIIEKSKNDKKIIDFLEKIQDENVKSGLTFLFNRYKNDNNQLLLQVLNKIHDLIEKITDKQLKELIIYNNILKENTLTADDIESNIEKDIKHYEAMQKLREFEDKYLRIIIINNYDKIYDSDLIELIKNVSNIIQFLDKWKSDKKKDNTFDFSDIKQLKCFYDKIEKYENYNLSSKINFSKLDLNIIKLIIPRMPLERILDMSLTIFSIKQDQELKDIIKEIVNIRHNICHPSLAEYQDSSCINKFCDEVHNKILKDDLCTKKDLQNIITYLKELDKEKLDKEKLDKEKLDKEKLDKEKL